MMPSDCDFSTCRQIVEWAARSVNGLSEAQLNCISEAFDTVGIKAKNPGSEVIVDCDRNITAGDSLLVYDVNGELQENYTLNICGTVC